MSLIRKMVTVLCFCILITSILTGCATAQNVYEAFERAELTDEELKLLTEGKLTYEIDDLEFERGNFENIKDYFEYRAYQFIKGGNQVLKGKVPVYIVVSIAIGGVLFLLARKAIKIRRMALLIFIIGIPFILMLLLYGTAILADILA